MYSEEHTFLPQLVSIRFQVLFHSASAVLFTFPSRYWFTIGHEVVFSLTKWSWQIHPEFLVFRVTWVSIRKSRLIFTYGTITLYGLTFQNYSVNQTVFDSSTYGYFGQN